MYDKSRMNHMPDKDQFEASNIGQWSEKRYEENRKNTPPQ